MEAAAETLGATSLVVVDPRACPVAPTLLTSSTPRLQLVKGKGKSTEEDPDLERAGPTTSVEMQAAADNPEKASTGQTVTALDTLRNTWAVARPFFSDRRTRCKAWLMTVLVWATVVGQAVSTLWLAEVLKQITNALINKDEATFKHSVLTIAMLVSCNFPLVILEQWLAGALALEWRRYTTVWLLERYIDPGQTYYRMQVQCHDMDNPDQRIGQDVSEFTASMVKLQVTLVSAFFNVLLMSAVLVAVCPDLFVILVGGAGAMTLLFLKVFGGRLMVLTRYVLSQEATFRFSLIRVRENAEPIAFYQGAAFELERCLSVFAQVLRFQYKKLTVYSLFLGGNRVLTGYASLFPTLILGPRILRGEIPFGVIMQANVLFSVLLASMTVIVSDMGIIASVGAQAIRVKHLTQTLDDLHTGAGGNGGIELCERSGGGASDDDDVCLELKSVALQAPHSQSPVLSELSLVLRRGEALLIGGESGIGKSSLLRAIGGLWTSGSGSISRFEVSRCFFVPQEPYLCEGSLRQNASYPLVVQDSSPGDCQSSSAAPSADDVADVLKAVNLGHLITRHGLDTEVNFESILSGGEKQRLGFARLLLRPGLDFALLDEATSALDERNEDALYTLLLARVRCHASVAHRPNLEKFHTHKLLLQRHSAGGCGGHVQRMETAGSCPSMALPRDGASE